MIHSIPIMDIQTLLLTGLVTTWKKCNCFKLNEQFCRRFLCMLVFMSSGISKEKTFFQPEQLDTTATLWHFLFSSLSFSRQTSLPSNRYEREGDGKKTSWTWSYSPWRKINFIFKHDVSVGLCELPMWAPFVCEFQKITSYLLLKQAHWSYFLS